MRVRTARLLAIGGATPYTIWRYVREVLNKACKEGHEMDYFNYKNGKLFAEDVDVEAIAAEVGTPAYIYSKATFMDHLHKMQEAYRRAGYDHLLFGQGLRQYPHPEAHGRAGQRI